MEAHDSQEECLAGEVYPADEIRDVYKKFLINQFHDILPGSHIHPVYEDAMNDYKEVRFAVNDFIGQELNTLILSTLQEIH